MPIVELTPDELLTTTRSVRKRLALPQPVEREVLEECLAIAQQAPNGSNLQRWSFVVVTDPDKRRELADLYRRAWEIFLASVPPPPADDPQQKKRRRVYDSANYLGEHLHEIPVLVVPCFRVRTEDLPVYRQAAIGGSIFPAVWSFMLAARARGLGSSLTGLHLFYEQEAAEILGIPYAEVMQTALVPVAYTRGTDFHAAQRAPLSTFVHWDAWSSCPNDPNGWVGGAGPAMTSANLHRQLTTT